MGGMKLGEGELYSLLYADDTMLVAEEKRELKSMTERLESYLERKRLEINVAKTKIMRFRRREGDWQKKMEVERRKDRRSERVYLSGIYSAKEWGTKGACEGEGKEGSGNNRAGMMYWEKKIREGIGVEDYDCLIDWYGL